MTDYTLTAEDARMLRKADALCFDTDSDGNGRIRAIVRGNDREHERTYSIPATDVRVENYTSDEGPWDCFHMTMNAPLVDESRTLVRHMRKGSRFVLLWTRGNDSESTRKAGMVVDELRVKVESGRTVDTFLVYRSVSLDNTARMVRRSFGVRNYAAVSEASDTTTKEN